MPAPAFGHFDGPRLARAREAAGLTRAQLAEKIGVGADVVGLWETRGVTPAAQHRPKVAEAVGLQVFDLYKPPEGTEGISGLRVRAGLSQRRLAQLVGVPQSTLSGWERGTVRLPDEKAALLASALSVTEDEVAQAALAAPAWTRERRGAPKAGVTDEGAPKRPASSELAEAARLFTHFVIAYLVQYSDDELPRAGEDPVKVYAPQGGEAAGGRPEDHMRLVVEASRRMASRSPGRAVPEVFLHNETQFEIDGEPVFALRRQIEPDDGGEDRDTLMRRLAALLVPQWTSSGPDEEGDPAAKRAMRRELFDNFPVSKAGVGRLFVAALPTDSYRWLLSQLEPGQSATAVFEEPDAAPAVRYLTHRPASGSEETDAWAALGLGPDSTLHEIAEAACDQS